MVFPYFHCASTFRMKIKYWCEWGHCIRDTITWCLRWNSYKHEHCLDTVVRYLNVSTLYTRRQKHFTAVGLHRTCARIMESCEDIVFSCLFVWSDWFRVSPAQHKPVDIQCRDVTKTEVREHRYLPSSSEFQVSTENFGRQFFLSIWLYELNVELK